MYAVRFILNPLFYTVYQAIRPSSDSYKVNPDPIALHRVSMTVTRLFTLRPSSQPQDCFPFGVLPFPGPSPVPAHIRPGTDESRNLYQCPTIPLQLISVKIKGIHFLTLQKAEIVLLCCLSNAFVAQRIEQRFPVPRVGGSIPSRRVLFLSFFVSPHSRNRMISLIARSIRLGSWNR